MPSIITATSTADFRELRVWQMAMDLTTDLYSVTSDFPRDERFGLTSQLRRAAVSIPSNIAEGNSRFERGDYRRFVSMARGSTGEVYTQVDVAHRLRYLPRGTFEEFTERCEDIKKMLGGLYASLA